MNRHAPAVCLALGDDRVWRWARRGAAVLVVLGTALWSTIDGAPRGLIAPGVTVLALLMAAATWPRRPSAPPPRLGWDGASWTLDEIPCHPRVAIDLGAWLLLDIRPVQGRRRWWALSEPDHRAVWHALRCALYCARPSSLRA